MKRPTNLVHCQPEHVRYLAQRMRPDEIEQWLAFSGEPVYRPESIVDYVLAERGTNYTVMGEDGIPAVAGGYFCLRVGVWQSWMVGTLDGWALHWRSITKAVRWLIAALLEVGAQRLETYVIASRVRAMDWYVRGMGLTLDPTYTEAGVFRYVRVA